MDKVLGTHRRQSCAGPSRVRVTDTYSAQVDVLLLENVAEEQIPAIGAAQLNSRLELAFEVLEKLRAKGLLRWYGFSSDYGLWRDVSHRNVAERDFRRGRFALERAVEIAQRVGGAEHGFR